MFAEAVAEGAGGDPYTRAAKHNFERVGNDEQEAQGNQQEDEEKNNGRGRSQEQPPDAELRFRRQAAAAAPGIGQFPSAGAHAFETASFMVALVRMIALSAPEESEVSSIMAVFHLSTTLGGLSRWPWLLTLVRTLDDIAYGADAGQAGGPSRH